MPSGNSAIVVTSPSTIVGVDGNVDFDVVGSDLSDEESEEGVHCGVCSSSTSVKSSLG
jgi:hypothetical protein